MKTPVTHERLQNHLTYSWWKYVLMMVLVIFFWSILFTTTRYRPPEEKKVIVGVYGAGNQTALDAYMEEMIAGQKVVKVFNHQKADLAEFAARNEKLRQAGTGAQSLSLIHISEPTRPY